MRHCQQDEKDEIRERNYRTFRSLRTAFTTFIFLILTLTCLITAVIMVILYRFGLFPMIIFTPLILPFATLGVCIFIGTIMAALVSQLIIKPLRRLIEATEEIKNGHYDVRVTEQTAIGELNNLLESFNSMAGELGNTELFRNDFINNFSHEFKTPIVSIRGFARQLQKDNENHFLTEQQRKEYTDIIVDESDRLARLSTNILMLTKFENQQIVTDKTEFYLDEQIRKAVLILEKQWEAKNIEFSLELDETKYVFNEEMLSQVWINLIGNAIKFSQDNGSISIRCRQKESNIIIDIIDSGEGMDALTVNKIFDKFYQCDTSHKSEGNGLGLSIVKRIVELAGGEISVISEHLKGSTFRVSLPAHTD